MQNLQFGVDDTDVSDVFHKSAIWVDEAEFSEYGLFIKHKITIKSSKNVAAFFVDETPRFLASKLNPI